MFNTKLHSFLKVAELGSFTKAAEALSLSQPAVTQHVKQLEENYQVSLFTRSPHQLQLTREGKVLLKYARRCTALEQTLLQEMAQVSGRIHPLTVGITQTAESSLTIEVLAAFNREMQPPNLKIITNVTETLLNMVVNYELDFAFVDKEIEQDDLYFTPLNTDTLVLAVSPEHPWAGLDHVSLKDLQKEPMILRLPSSNTRNLFVASLESMNRNIRDFNVFMEIDSISTIKDLIRRNFGVSVLAKSACMDEYRRGLLVLLPIENLNMERTRYLASRRDYEHPELIDHLVSIYKKMMNP